MTYVTRKQKNVSPTIGLVFYFSYHKKIQMRHLIRADDKKILGRHFARSLKSGLTVEQVEHMIDLFYSSPLANSNFPALMFVKKTTQDKLLGQVHMTSTDPHADWLLSGMPDTDTIEDAALLRRLLLLFSHDGIMRYPGVVLGIIKTGRSADDIRQMLMDLEDLLVWNLTPEILHVPRPNTTLLDSLGILPSELATNRRSPKSIAEASATVTEAVARYIRNR